LVNLRVLQVSRSGKCSVLASLILILPSIEQIDADAELLCDGPGRFLTSENQLNSINLELLAVLAA